MKSIVLIILSIYVVLTLVVYLLQRTLLYFPTPYIKEANEKEIYFDFDNIKLQGWVINEGFEKALIYYGGNAELINDNIEFFKKLFPNTTVYLVNYRGYGKSEGEPSQKNIFADAIKIFDEIKQKHSSISLMGRSLGSGVASFVASKKEIERLVLVTPYDSILNVAKQAYSFLPVSFLLKDRYESVKYIPNIKAKTLILYGANDEVISSQRTKALIKSFKKEQLQVVLIPNANHNDISLYPIYIKSLKAFFD